MSKMSRDTDILLGRIERAQDERPTDADQQCSEVPLVEQLRSIPKDYRTSRAIQWSDDGRETGHQFIPVGFMMHRAADLIESLQSASVERDLLERSLPLLRGHVHGGDMVKRIEARLSSTRTFFQECADTPLMRDVMAERDRYKALAEQRSASGRTPEQRALDIVCKGSGYQYWWISNSGMLFFERPGKPGHTEVLLVERCASADSTSEREGK